QDVQAVVATTADQADLLRAEPYRVSSRRLRVIPPGFDAERFRPDPTLSREERKRSLGWSGKTIFTLGRIAENKGYDLILQAFPQVLTQQPDAFLVLGVGGESLSANEAQSMADLRSLASN